MLSRLEIVVSACVLTVSCVVVGGAGGGRVFKFYTRQSHFMYSRLPCKCGMLHFCLQETLISYCDLA